MSSLADIESFLRRVAAAPAETLLPDVDALSDAEFSRALQTARATSLEGQLLAALEMGVIHLPGRQLELFADRHRRAMIHSLRTEQGLLEASGALRGSGIRHCVLKGVALARTVYGDPATRTFNDADLLIEPGRLAEAADLLARDGWQRVLPEIAPGFDDRFAKDLPVVRSGVAIDLHRTLISGPFGVRIDVAGMLDRAAHAWIGAQRLAVLDVVDRYLHAALTAGAGDVPPRLVTLTDLLVLERTSDFDADELTRRAELAGVGPPVARGIRVLRETLRLTQDPAGLAWAMRRVNSRAEQLFLATYLSRDRSYKRTIGFIAAQANWRDRAALARAAVLPSREYRHARSWTTRSHATRAVRSILR